MNRTYVSCLLLPVLTGVALGAPPKPYKVVATYKIGGEGGWDYLTIDAASRRLFVSRSSRIDVVNCDTGKVVGTIDNLKGVHQAVFAPKHHHGFTSNGGDSTVTVFDLATLKEVERIKVGSRPDAILYEASSDRVFTFNAGDRNATAVDAKTSKVVGSVALGGKPEFPRTDDKGHIFVNVEDTSEIAEFDAKTLTVLKRWSLKPGDGPSGLAYDAKSQRLFSVCDEKTMVVSDAVHGKVVTTVAIGDGPDAAAFDPAQKLVFSSNGEGTLTVVHEDTPDKYTVLQNVETKRSARTCVWDPKTHRIFLAAAEMQAPAPGQRRGSMTPGSFCIVVVGQ